MIMNRNLLVLVLFSSIIFSISVYSQISFADLSFSEEFGTEGDDNDQFDKPTDLAINNNGDKLYVVDRDNNRIKIYELTGGDNCSSGNDEIIDDEVCFDETFGDSGSVDARLDVPTDLAINKDSGDIYVVDSDNNRVVRYQADGDYDNFEIGSSNSNDNEYLGLPTAIAIDRQNEYVYVADSTTDSISVFEENGDFRFNFGDEGSSDDEFDNPSGMVINNSDQILYVADTENHRIKIYELTDGDECPNETDEVERDEVCFVDDFGSEGSGDGRFDKPSGLAYDEDNDLLYVADTDNDRIQVFEIVSGNNCPSGTDKIIDGVCFVEEFGSSGSADGRFNSPEGIAIDEDNKILYVADTDNDRIQMLSVTESSSSDTLAFFEEFGTEGDDNDQFDTPTDLAVGNDEELYVADSENNRIKIYELTGGDNCSSGNDEIIDDEVCFDETFGTSGSSDGRFDIPTDLAVDPDNGDVYVVDSDNNRVQRFESNGDYDNFEIGSSNSNDNEYLGSPSAITIDRKSDLIYVADSTTDSISAFEKNGDYRFNFKDDDSGDDFSNPSAMVINNSDQILYVADTNNDRIRIFELTDGDECPNETDEVERDEVCFVDDFGSEGSGDGRFDKPSGLAYDEDNDLLYVADTDNDRIQVFEIVSGNNCPSGTDKIIDGVCFVEEFGSSGSADGRFNSPEGISLDLENGKLYVADTDNHRIQILSVPSGTSSSSGSGSSSSGDDPSTPQGLRAEPASTSSIVVTWNSPDPDDNDPEVTGYKIEVREGGGSYTTINSDTKSTVTAFLHTGLDEGENYRYKVSAINSEGTSGAATSSTVKPASTLVPSGVTATAISKNQILLNWVPPTDTFKQSITGYEIEREIIEDILYDDVASVSGSTTEYTVSGLETDKEYSYVITANFAVGNSPRSSSASATPHDDAEAPTTSMITSSGGSSSSGSDTVPSAPRSLNAVASSSQIQLTWKEPSSDGNSSITGYKVEVKKNNGSYTTLESNTPAKSYTDHNVDVGATYTYRVSAINSVGTGTTATDSAIPKNAVLDISPLGKFNIDEKKTLSFTVKITDSSISNVAFSLENSPAGSKINANSGLFTWTPTDSQGGKTYTFDVKASNGSMTDRQSIIITVNDVEPVKDPEPPTQEPTTPEPPTELGTAPFVDESKDPQSYVDRYNNEPSYKEWFDENYPEYSSIYQAVGLEEPVETPAFVDPNQDPQYYVDRYNNEPSYKEWFDENYPEYSSIYQAVGLEEPVEEEDPEPQIGQCGPGTELIDGKCELVSQENGGGCLIATAAYGSEMSPQVQILREIRDGKVMNTQSGASFMTGFNSLYYSFSPYIADYQRENPAFKEIVKIGITPMLSTLSIMSLADTESEIVGYGIGVILLNLGMYVAAPAMILAYGINKARSNRKVRF